MEATQGWQFTVVPTGFRHQREGRSHTSEADLLFGEKLVLFLRVIA